MTETEWLTSDDPARMLAFLRPTPEYLARYYSDESLRARMPRASDRKLRLFACACLRYSWRGLTANGSRENVELAERIADGLEQPIPTLLDDPNSMDHMAICGANALEATHYGGMYAGNLFTDRPTQAALLRDIFGNPFRPIVLTDLKPGDDLTMKDDPIRLEKASYGQRVNATVAEIRGSEMVVIPAYDRTHRGRWLLPKPSWLTWRNGTIPKIAQAIYEERRFEDMPILADALQEAGCENEEILRHCRGWERILLHPNRYEPDPEHSMLRLQEVWHRNETSCQHVRGCWVIDLLLRKE